MIFIVGGYAWVVVSGNYVKNSMFYGVIYNALGLLFMFHIYTFITSLFTGGVYKLLGKYISKYKKPLGVLTIVIPAIAVSYGFIKAQTYEVTRLVFNTSNSSGPVVFAHIPDLHLGHQRGADYLAKVIKSAEDAGADFILYNGDLFDSNVALNESVLQVLSSAKIPQFYTTGNHEFYMDTQRALNLLHSAGVRILSSEVVKINGIQLVGLEYMNADRKSHDPHSVNSLYMDERLPKIAVDRSEPIILAHHSPVGIDYAKNFGADIYVAGHTHGGQVFPATLLVGKSFPYYQGVNEYQGMKMVVSEGAGTFGPWMRLGSRNEIQIITVN